MPESPIYTQLVKLEQNIDASFARKQVEIQEAVNNAPRVPSILRVYIYNEHDNQESAATSSYPPPPTNNLEPPSWTLKVVGRLLDPQTAEPLPIGPSTFKFSDLLSKVVIQLDTRVMPSETSTIEWRKSIAPSITDGFEVKRLGNKQCEATITLYLDYSPRRYRLLKPLCEILGIDVETESCILAALFHYIRGKYEKYPEDPWILHLDHELAEVFGTSTLPALELPSKLQRFLLPPDPFIFKHTIRVDGPPEQTLSAYDIEVSLPCIFNPNIFTSSIPTRPPSYPKEVHTLNEQIGEVLKKIRLRLRMREYLMGFADAPADAIKLMIAGQARSTRPISQDGRDPEQEMRAEYYQQEWLADAVDRYLSQQPQAFSHWRME